MPHIILLQPFIPQKGTDGWTKKSGGAQAQMGSCAISGPPLGRTVGHPPQSVLSTPKPSGCGTCSSADPAQYPAATCSS